MKFFALIAAAAAIRLETSPSKNPWNGGAPGVTPTDTRQSDGPVPAPQRMSGVNGSVAEIPATKRRWLHNGGYHPSD